MKLKEYSYTVTFEDGFTTSGKTKAYSEKSAKKQMKDWHEYIFEAPVKQVQLT